MLEQSRETGETWLHSRWWEAATLTGTSHLLPGPGTSLATRALDGPQRTGVSIDRRPSFTMPARG